MKGLKPHTRIPSNPVALYASLVAFQQEWIVTYSILVDGDPANL